MNPERWKQIDQLLDAAFELPPEKRAAFLEEACGEDQDMKKEVEVLLASDARARSFIEAPAAKIAAEVFAKGESALHSGQSVGPYTILSKIGTGGMGEVYRAKDQRLGRDVAIKILPMELAANPERLKRFEREARTASALNHPNIVTVYDIGSVDSQTYIAMEFIDGKTLRAVGQLPLPKILNIASQIADGLAKAHAAGIIHRDLKPENIMITKDGFAKILDFGVAKLLPSSSEGLTQEETETRAGTILGTVAYMSPEQAVGQSLDFRSDQFAFGTILYEMISRKHPFHRKTPAKTLSAVINENPPALTQVPTPIAWIIERCLAKDPDDRYESTRDLAKEIQKVRDYYTKTETSAPDLHPGRSHKKKNVLLKSAVAAVMLLLVAATVVFYRKSLTPSPLTYHRLTYRRGFISSAKFSSDGETIIYSGDTQGKPKEILLTRRKGVDSLSLGIPNAEILSISSIGEMAILQNAGKTSVSPGVLAVISLSGGAPREIADQVSAACWTPTGSDLAIVRRIGKKSRLELPVGKVLYETPFYIRRLQISPDNKLLAVEEHPTLDVAIGSVIILNSAGKKMAAFEDLFPEGIAWHDSNELWVANWNGPEGAGSELYALRSSGKLRLIQRFPHAALHDISRDGKTLLTYEDTRKETSVVLSDPSEQRDLSWLDGTEVADISSDGKNVLLREQGEATSYIGSAYLRRIDGSPAILLSDGIARNLSNDGKYALISKPQIANPQGSSLLLVPTRFGATKSFHIGRFRAENTMPNPTLSPDARYILFNGCENGHSPRVYLQEVAGGEPHPITAERVQALPSTISADGKFFLGKDSDQKIYIYSLEGSPRRPVTGLAENEEPFQWNQNGTALYVYKPDFLPFEIFRLNPFSGERTLVKKLSTSDVTGIDILIAVRLTGDEKTFVFSYGRTLSTLYMVTGLK